MLVLCLSNRQRALSVGDARIGLPERCDKSWFQKTFCGGDPEVFMRGIDDVIWDCVVGFQMYDSLAVLAAVPSIREALFTPMRHNYNGVENVIYGMSTEDSGLSEVQQKHSVEFLDKCFLAGTVPPHTLSYQHLHMIFQALSEHV